MYIFGWYLPQHRYRNSKPTCSHWSILPADNSSVFGLSKTSPRSIARTGRSAWSNTNTKKTWQIENGKGMCFPFFGGRWNLELRDSIRVLIWDSDRKKKHDSTGLTVVTFFEDSLPYLGFLVDLDFQTEVMLLLKSLQFCVLCSYKQTYLHRNQSADTPSPWPSLYPLNSYQLAAWSWHGFFSKRLTSEHTKRRGPCCQLCPTLCKIRGRNPLKRHFLKILYSHVYIYIYI